ncbi:Glycerophosphoryl diester phosphodiesterase [Planctomycetes bacterium Poly30]|uniref:Glycerophosphoryl diester phosphodiesterase n=1 Tax=Saltatorellus ferox TaxID=2528018 RepID=A0A518EVJ2_9BACT|nr:Glycerophosphoryl diester phosphodiesterase [Planctomycetes bacterium Poly30]
MSDSTSSGEPENRFRAPLERDVYAGLADLGVSGAQFGGPPLILGHRGAPREAPENTLASLRRALELGLDGVEYDVRACASGDPVIFHDATLRRTTGMPGRIRDVDLRELYGLDAGGWFSRRFHGEQVPILDEALGLTSERRGEPPFHMIELKEAGLVEPLVQLLAERRPPVPCRVASFRRDVVLEARDRGLPAMLLGVLANEYDRRFVRDERIAAYSVGPGGWRTEAAAEDWSFTECWAWAIDDPDELLELCRRPLFGLNTNEPHRALAARALARMQPGSNHPYPIEAPELFVEPETLASPERGEWFGSWDTAASITNPMPFPVTVRASIFVPQGAFDIDGLPRAFDLEAHEQRSIPFRISGGARSPGPDPLLGALLEWKEASALSGSELQPGGQLLLDAPLVRRRIATADGLARRLTTLRESPGQRAATITIRRIGGELQVRLENSGSLKKGHLIARLGDDVVRGGEGLRLRLPRWFDSRPVGVPFSCGVEGRNSRGEPALFRWAGGLPEGLGHGKPGLLVPLMRG